MHSVSRRSLVQWVLMLALAGLLLGWQLVERSVSRSRRTAMDLSSASVPRESDTFVALRYADFRYPEEWSEAAAAERLRKQMNLLSREGYTAIGLEDVMAFYCQGKLLPKKSVLITFDGGRRDVYRLANKALQRNSLRGVIFVMSQKQEKRDRFFLTWHELKKAFHTGYWDIGSMGMHSAGYVRIDERGASGHFLSHRRWLAGQRRLETENEYGRRIRRDIWDGADIVEKRVGDLRVVAFAYPFSDYGQSSANSDRAETAIRAAIGSRHSVAFKHGGYGWNFAKTDALLLGRVPVQAAWSPQELLRRLELTAPKQGDFADDFESSLLSGCWYLESGVCASGNGRLILAPKPLQRGGQIWLSGTEKWRNCSVELTSATSGGDQCWVYLRHRNKDNFVRVGLSGKDVYIQEKVDGQKLRSLMRCPDVFEPTKPHRYSVALTGQRIHLSYDGVPIETSKIMINDGLRTGKIGLGIRTQERGEGPCVFSAFRASERGSVLALFRDLGSTAAQEQISSLLPRIEILSPAWFTMATGTGPLELQPETQDLVRMLASYNSLRLIPTVRCGFAQPGIPGVLKNVEAQSNVADDLIEHAHRLKLDGFLFWLEPEDSSPRVAPAATGHRAIVPTWLVSLRDRLRSEGLRFGLAIRFESASQFKRNLLKLSDLADIIVADIRGEDFTGTPSWLGSPQTRSWTVSRTQLFVVSPWQSVATDAGLDPALAGLGRAILVGDQESTQQEETSQEDSE